MTAWGLVGVLGGLVARAARGHEPRRLPLALLCAAAGFGYGALLDVYQWTLSAEHTTASYLAVSASSFPYNLAHALGNFTFALLIGPAFIRALSRYRRRFELRWERPAVAAVVLALVVPVALGNAQPAQAATPQQRALSYLEKAQNKDGGFGTAPGVSSSQLYTGWAGLGLAAAGLSPIDAKHPRQTPIDFTRAHARELNDIGELERTILLLRAAGVSPRSFAGRDLVSQLAAKQRPDGSWERLVDHTAFGIFALHASGSSADVRSALLWLLKQQNRDGGFGFGAAGGSSDVDDTGSVLQALAAGGKRGSKVVKGAVSYLRHAQNPDGGFGQEKAQSSNAQSTAWAVQGLLAVGRNPGALKRNGHTPLTYITSLQTANGSVRYSRTSAQTPVWVTAEALVALSRRWLPLAPPPRKATAVQAAPAKHQAPSTKHQAPKVRRHRRHPATPVATIAQTTPAPAPPVRTAPVAATTKPKHKNDSPALEIVLGALAAAALVWLGFKARGRLRTILR